MKIEDVRIVVSRPGRNYTTVIVETSGGLVGVGDATLNGRELSVAAYLEEHIKPLLLGQDASQIERIWQYLYRGAYWRRGPVTMTAISAIDQALWDLAGKRMQVPVYELLGGRSRDTCMVYRHASGMGPQDLYAEVERYLKEGAQAIRLQVGVPKLEVIYGIGKTGPAQLDSPADGLPLQEKWSTQAYLAYVPEVLKQARSDFGPEVHLLHDVHHRLTPIEAARMAKEVEPANLFWLEDFTPAEDQEAVRLVRRASTTPLAIGEIFNSFYDTQHLITERLIDYVRMSVTHGGGISQLKKILEMASFYQIRSGAHGPQDVSPIGMAAAVHLGLSIHNFGIQEYMGYSQSALDVFRPGFRLVDGHGLDVDDRPGLGIDFDENAAQQFKYERSYLPVNTRLDGSVHDW
ncbi:D-mannonate dehydratase ManD [Tessaracoccus sp. MC1756]|uniref:D-mannonate dehydratase ManD n=1 Tax=Tessaracoccus sp. MC1756 TaxID=2760311 RepID=UPI0015FF910E|nr:D-mannonate dehydratase ManD [Tessaracoccus sp. MC1756]MBB1510979.1 D-galactonate dehydratase family protein [Tessaracoccus sp. MC1756]